MSQFLRRLRTLRRGQVSAEYMILLAVISILVAVSVNNYLGDARRPNSPVHDAARDLTGNQIKGMVGGEGGCGAKGTC